MYISPPKYRFPHVQSLLWNAEPDKTTWLHINISSHLKSFLIFISLPPLWNVFGKLSPTTKYVRLRFKNLKLFVFGAVLLRHLPKLNLKHLYFFCNILRTIPNQAKLSSGIPKLALSSVCPVPSKQESKNIALSFLSSLLVGFIKSLCVSHH